MSHWSSWWHSVTRARSHHWHGRGRGHSGWRRRHTRWGRHLGWWWSTWSRSWPDSRGPWWTIVFWAWAWRSLWGRPSGWWSLSLHRWRCWSWNLGIHFEGKLQEKLKIQNCVLRQNIQNRIEYQAISCTKASSNTANHLTDTRKEITFEPPHDKTNKIIFAPSEDSHQSLRCPHQETLAPQLPIECTAKTDQTGRLPRLI